MELKVIAKARATRFVNKHHYSKVMPRLTKLCLGWIKKYNLVGTMTLGWGVRPLHTIKKLFPSLETKDYWEIGKLCLTDKMPRNSESQFISQCLNFIKQRFPQKKLIFTWSDGMLGKPGYVYQASNFLYGGYIWTDTYFTEDGEKVHPRLTNRIGGRPNKKQLKKLGWKHYRGKQFRYIYFLCSHKERKELLSETQYKWRVSGPKEKDLTWKVYKIENEEWKKTNKPEYNPNELGFRSPTPLLKYAE